MAASAVRLVVTAGESSAGQHPSQLLTLLRGELGEATTQGIGAARRGAETAAHGIHLGGHDMACKHGAREEGCDSGLRTGQVGLRAPGSLRP